MQSSEMPDSNDAISDPWIFPGPLPSDARRLHDKDFVPVMLCTLTDDEASDLCSKLESNGIRCERAWETEREPNQQEPRRVAVLVGETDLVSAQAIRDGHEPIITPEEDAESAEMAQLRIEDFICPQCDKRKLQNLGLSRGWATVRNGCLCLLALPFVFTLITGQTIKQATETCGIWAVLWLGVSALFIFALKGAPRARRCTECGWRSDAPSNS